MPCHLLRGELLPRSFASKQVGTTTPTAHDVCKIFHRLVCISHDNVQIQRRKYCEKPIAASFQNPTGCFRCRVVKVKYANIEVMITKHWMKVSDANSKNLRFLRSVPEVAVKVPHGVEFFAFHDVILSKCKARLRGSPQRQPNGLIELIRVIVLNDSEMMLLGVVVKRFLFKIV